MLSWIQLAIALLLAAFGSVEATTYGTCHYLNQTAEARLYNPCVYVVDYAFYVPVGKTVDDLQIAINEKLNNSQLLELPTACTASLVRYACSLVYYKCLPQFVALGATSDRIYKNDTGDSVYLPIQRPCVSVCTDIQTNCTSGLYEATQSYPSCYDTYDFAGVSALPKPYQFDLKNNESACYVPNFITNAYIKETYTRNGSYSPCIGLVDEFINPPGTSINSSYTTLQLSGVYQDTVNTELLKVVSKIPKWLGTECRLAALQYFCYRFFYKPEGITFGEALTYSLTKEGIVTATQTALKTAISEKYSGLLTTTLYFPSYANRSWCNGYSDTCASFIQTADNSQLIANCSLTAKDFKIFPDGTNQTISTISIKPSTSTLTIYFITQPDYTGYYNSSEYIVTEPTCPTNYVIPDNPDGKYVTPVEGSACAAGCKLAEWTNKEWDSFHRIAVAAPSISLALGSLLMIFVIVAQDFKQSYLIFLFTILSMMCSGSLLHVQSAYGFEERYCFDNAQPLSQETDATSACVHQAILATYIFLCSLLVMFVLSVHRLLRLQGKDAIIDHVAYIPVQAAIVFLPPIIPVVYGASNKYFGFAGIQPWCFFRTYPNIPQNLDVFWLGWPVLVVSFFTYSLLIISEIVFIVQRVQAPAYKAVVRDVEMVAQPEENSQAVIKIEEAEAANSVLGAPTTASETVAPRDIIDPNAGGAAAAAGGAPAIPPVELVQGLVVLVSLIIAGAFVAGRVQAYEFEKPYARSFKEYTKCAFKNFDGTDSYMNVCGEHPAYRPKKSNVGFFIIVVFSNMIIIAPTYFIAFLAQYLFLGSGRVANRTVNDAPTGEKSA